MRFRIDQFEPYVLEPPLRLELSLKHYRPVELLAYLPNVERVNSHTVPFVGQDILELSRFLGVALGYSVDLEPWPDTSGGYRTKTFRA